MIVNPFVSLCLFVGSYFLAYFSRLYFPRLARINIVIVMVIAFFLEIFLLAGIGIARGVR